MSDETDNYNEIVDSVYDSALIPEHFEAFLRAWDATFTDQDVERSQDLLMSSADVLSRHFQRADQIFQTTHIRSENTIEAIVEQQPTSAFICDAKGHIHALNDGARKGLSLNVGGSVYDLPFDVKTAEQLKKLFRKKHADGNNGLKSFALRDLHREKYYHQSLVLLVQFLPISNQLGHCFLFKSSLANWHSGIEQVLSSAFELTPAEIEIIKHLNMGLSLKEIAELRDRSLATIRTQVKNILQKTDISSQTALMRHVTSLLLVAHSLSQETVKSSRTETRAELNQLQGSSGRLIQYRDFGDEQHPAVVCFTPILSDMPDREFLQKFIEAELRVITVKEGDPPPSFVKDKQAFSDLMNDYHTVVKHLNLSSFTLLGHCVGGVYAAEYAKKFPDQVSKIVCVDTGAPLSTKKQWDKMGKTARRSFMVAKQFPSFLNWPHRLTARDFFSGEKGQQSVIEYFYGDNPNDLNLIEKNPNIRRWSLGMLEYSLEDIHRPIRAVEMWVQDWSETLNAVAHSTAMVFVHGSDNRQFLIEDVQALSIRYDNISILVAQGASQLTFITHLSDIIEAIKRSK